MRKYLFILIFISLPNLSEAQDLKALDTLSAKEVIDTLFIDKDLNNWSFRLFLGLKEHRLRVSNANASVSLIPNNPFGVGFGVATKKLVLDIGFNIKTDSERTERFDMQGNFIQRNHQLGFYFQNYQGFNIRDNDVGILDFREDIKLQSAGITYLYMFNARKYSYSSLKTGLVRQKKSSHSFGVGGFVTQISQKADSTFIINDLKESFNEQAQILNSLNIGVGGSVGASALIVLPANFFISLECVVGIGLNYHEIETESTSYKPDNPFVYQLGLMADIGYNGPNIYINLSINDNLFGTDMDFGNHGNYNQINAKLAIGFKYGRKKYLRLNDQLPSSKKRK